VGRSDDQNWRQHDWRPEKPTHESTIASMRSSEKGRTAKDDVGALSVAAPEFVPQAVPQAAEASVMGPYSFIALSATGQPVTMILQPTAAAPKYFALPTEASKSNLVGAPTPIFNSVHGQQIHAQAHSYPSTSSGNKLASHVQFPESLDQPDVNVYQRRREVNVDSAPVMTSNPPALTTDAAERKCSGGDSKILSPRDSKTGYSRVTHRGSQNVSNDSASKDAENSTPDRPAAKITPQPPTGPPRPRGQKHPSDVAYSTSQTDFKSGQRNAVAPKRILTRGKQQQQNQTQQPFSKNDSDFPALDRKMKELKLEAEAREETPITWRRSVEPNTRRENNSVSKVSYASRLKSAHASEVKNALKGDNADVVDESKLKKEGEIAETEENAPEKRRRRRRRRRRKNVDPNAEPIEDEEEVDNDAKKPTDEQSEHQDSVTASSQPACADRDITVENGAVMIRIENSSATSGKSVNKDEESKEEKIFKDDDFPDFLVDLRRGASGNAPRRIPRVIGSKVTKLGAGKPLAKTVHEWTDISDEVDPKMNEKEPLKDDSQTAGSRAPVVAAGAWGNSAARSFAEALKLVAKKIPTPSPSSDEEPELMEPDQSGKKKRKRKRKKKSKADPSVPAPAQPVKKSKAPLTFDLAALVPRKVGLSGQQSQKKNNAVKKSAPEPVPGTIKFRGKEREKPKAKRPSKMRRVIASERQLRRQRRELLLKLQAALHAPHALYIPGQQPQSTSTPYTSAAPARDSIPNGHEENGKQSMITSVQPSQVQNISEKDDWLTTDAESDDEVETLSKSTTANEVTSILEKKTVEESEPNTEDKADDEELAALDKLQLEEKVAENLHALQGVENRIKHWGPKALHNRKFREYCTHFVDKEVNALVKSLMLELMRFQDKIYFKEKESKVNMFKQKRRFFNGLREVLKYVKLRKLKLLIVASDVESIQSSGGLDDVMDQILQEANDQRVFTIFTMSRFALGKLMKKPVPVSCVGVRDFGGCESIVKELKKKVEEKNEGVRREGGGSTIEGGFAGGKCRGARR